MSESVIADFVGKFNAENTPPGEPIAGRILLSPKRLVLAADGNTRLQIPVSKIFDVGVGHVPPDLGDFFDSTVTVAFERDGRRYVAAVEAGDEKIEKFSAVLFRTILNGTETSLKHPARRAGRVLDGEYATTAVEIRPGRARFSDDEGSVDIELSAVTGVERLSREIGGRRRPVLAVRQDRDGTAVTTYLATPAPRKLSILGRYLRLEYADLATDLADVELSTEETQLLIAIYAGASDPGTALSVDPAATEELLADLAGEGLVDPDGPELTQKGKVLVSTHFRSSGA